MQRVISETAKPIKIWATDMEPEAEQQVRNLGNMPFIWKHVAVMPDAHAGKGSTIGTVIATRGAIIPAAVGVDIGCGMCAVKTPFKVDELTHLSALRDSIERMIPTGNNGNKEVSEVAQIRLESLGNFSATAHDKLKGHMLDKAAQQLGSLGGGNHFIEICADTEGQIWIMLHSGSRGIGNQLARIHMDRAQDIMKQYFIGLPDPDLAYLAQGTPEFKEYMTDLMWGQKYARANRDEMMDRVREALWFHILGDHAPVIPDEFRVDCHHNYTAWENHGGQNVMVTRKGAVSAKEGEWGIIPGSMGTKSYIVKGKGNPESFCSCSHGAGRRMSRNKARATFTVEDLKQQTLGVECLKTDGVLDEIPGAYKDIDVVMANQADLVEPVYQLKQLLCVKGA